MDTDTNEKVTTLKAAVGSGNILFKEGYIGIYNYGDERGDIFGELYADDTRILYKSAPLDPDWGFGMPDYDKYWDMPEGGVTFTLNAGHNSTVDETVTVSIEPAVPGVVITATTGLALLTIASVTLLAILMQK